MFFASFNDSRKIHLQTSIQHYEIAQSTYGDNFLSINNT